MFYHLIVSRWFSDGSWHDLERGVRGRTGLFDSLSVLDRTCCLSVGNRTSKS